jgi:hypothetical protein
VVGRARPERKAKAEKVAIAAHLEAEEAEEIGRVRFMAPIMVSLLPRRG